MNKNVWVYTLAINIIYIVCWVVLAIAFNKWWVALFAALFVTTPKFATVQKYYRICDQCGKQSPYADSYNEAIDKAKAAGWIIRKDGDKWDDRCPECQKEGTINV